MRFCKEGLGEGLVWHVSKSMLALCEVLGWQAQDDDVIRSVIMLSRSLYHRYNNRHTGLQSYHEKRGFYLSCSNHRYLRPGKLKYAVC